MRNGTACASSMASEYPTGVSARASSRSSRSDVRHSRPRIRLHCPARILAQRAVAVQVVRVFSGTDIMISANPPYEMPIHCTLGRKAYMFALRPCAVTPLPSIHTAPASCISQGCDFANSSCGVRCRIHGVAAHDDVGACRADALDRLHADTTVDLDEHGFITGLVQPSRQCVLP